jgi:hypothetical protein
MSEFSKANAAFQREHGYVANGGQWVEGSVQIHLEKKAAEYRAMGIPHEPQIGTARRCCDSEGNIKYRRPTDEEFEKDAAEYRQYMEIVNSAVTVHMQKKGYSGEELSEKVAAYIEKEQLIHEYRLKRPEQSTERGKRQANNLFWGKEGANGERIPGEGDTLFGDDENIIDRPKRKHYGEDGF